MFIILVSVIAIIFILFWQTIFSVVSSYGSNATKSSQSFIGNIWFISLLVINITIVIFILVFYYYKSNEKGKNGLDGNKGFKGQSGEPCYMKNNCVNHS